MTSDKTFYSKNLNDFSAKLKDVFVKRIYFDKDKTPEFCKDDIPFQFEYCYTIGLLTNEQYLVIQTSMTNDGIETFWTREQNDLTRPADFMEINSELKMVKVENSSLDLPYKITLGFVNQKVICICGEIYANGNKSYDYKTNDEMILCFTSNNDVEAFEKLTDNH